MSTDRPSLPLSAAEAVAFDVLELLRPYVLRAEVAGSIRRRSPSVKDIEIVAEPAWVEEGFWREPRPAIPEIHELAHTLGRVLKCGDRYVQVELHLEERPMLDLFLVHPPAEWGTIFAIRTGPAAFARQAVTRLRERKWRCTDGRILDEWDRPVPTPTEEAFFAAAGLPFIRPEDRR